MVYFSQAWQDEFVSNMLNFKRNGYFLDIGSFNPFGQSNSYHFESELGWKGICVEMGKDFVEQYRTGRTCRFLNEDATKVDYVKVLKEENFPNRIDYLSVDIDESSAEALKALPLDHYRASVITIEHDAYRFGDVIRNVEMEILRHYNYICLFPDVLVPLGCGMGPDLRFEHWYIDPIVFDLTKLFNLAGKMNGKKMYPDVIVETVKSSKEKYLL